MTVPSEGTIAGGSRGLRAASQVVPLTEAPEARCTAPTPRGRTAMVAARGHRWMAVRPKAPLTRCALTGASVGTGPTVQTAPSGPTGALSPTGPSALTGQTGPAALSVPPGRRRDQGGAVPGAPEHASHQPRRVGTLTPTLRAAVRHNVSGA